MRLVIAEKPSLARAIADALPGPHKRAATHIECGGDTIVAWCAGHILETAPPEAYAEEYKHWRLEQLPIVPSEWKREVKTPELLRAIKALLKSAKRVVHAGDPDREGQLLVDEVLDHLGYKGPVDRVLISDTTPDAVRTQFGKLRPNREFFGLSQSALARQRADWLYGMNMSRLYTLLGRAAGYEGVLSVGRVQTPLLGLIVARDRAIESFVPVPYYAITAAVQATGGATFRAVWQPGPSVQADLDPDGRLLKRELALSVQARTQRARGTVAEHTQEEKSEAPPLPYSLAELQMDAGRRLGLSAAQVLDACQALYEQHRLTTYPRSDCSYLPEGHFAHARPVLAAVAVHAPALAPWVGKADLTVRSRAWNDKKITAHHAIVPTTSTASANLTEPQRAIYDLIARRYLVQFFHPCAFLQTRARLDIAGESFVAHGRQIRDPGWKAAVTEPPAEETAAEPDDPGSATALLPPLAVGDGVTALDISIADKRTQPPRPFTDASLMQAMCNVGKFVSNPNVKKVLTETDGIGTPATRAAIIETLFERGYVTRQKKAIVSTPTGQALVQALPDILTAPDLTALWETAMRAIAEGQQSLDAFLSRIQAQLRQLIDEGRARGRIVVPAAAATSSSKPPPARYTAPASGHGKKKPRRRAPAQNGAPD
jgi:DNA topoisomerase-3